MLQRQSRKFASVNSSELHRAQYGKQRRRRLRVELLEDRRVLAIDVPPLLDISTTPDSGLSPFGNQILEVGGHAYFWASTPTTGRELWRSDGSTAGTVLVKEIRPGVVGATGFENSLTNLNGFLYFIADDGIHGHQLWKSDGTTSGTVMITGASGNTRSARFDSPLTKVDNTLYFFDRFGTSGGGLWKSDGTTAGTELVAASPTPGGFRNAGSMTSFNGQLYFVASDSIAGLELWKSDGTSAGTRMVKDINPGVFGSYPSGLTNVNGMLYFRATSSATGAELWKSNGSSEGTVLVKDIAVGSANSLSFGDEMIDANGKLYFIANDGTKGPSLWKSDGTARGTVLVKDIDAEDSSSRVSNLTNVNGTIFFSGYKQGLVPRLWKSDGTSAGTRLVQSDLSHPAGPSPLKLSNVNGTLFFSAYSGVEYGVELWKSDGTAVGTVMVKDIQPGASSSLNFGNLLHSVNGSLYFSAATESTGLELWKSNGTDVGTVLIKDISRGTASSLGHFTGGPNGDVANVNGTLFFQAENTLWKSDGTAVGTKKVTDGDSEDQLSSIRELTNVNGSLFFTAHHPDFGNELWKSDGTDAGTNVVKDTRIGTEGSFPRDLINANGTLYFTNKDDANGFELWRSNGTVDGTVMVKDLRQGIEGSYPSELTSIDGVLYFIASSDSISNQLFRSDGTAAGTVPVSEFISRYIPSSARMLTAVNSTLFFAANGGELWKFDGTADGTGLVKNIRSNVSQFIISQLVNVDGTLYFVANDGVHGDELWRSDGTSSGTVMVKDIRVGSLGASISNLVDVDGTLYFSADNGIHGGELWKSDGTAAGTALVRNIRPGGDSAFPRNLTNVGGSVYFTANNGVSGEELWKSDGTVAGTVRVIEIASASAGSSPDSLILIKDKLFFSASTDTFGRELYSIPVDLPPTEISLSSTILQENLPIGTLVGTLSSLDPNPNGTFTYAFVQGAGDVDNANFRIDGQNLLALASFDFETKSSHSIRIRTTDSSGKYFEKSFQIRINDIDETPLSIASFTPSLSQGEIPAGSTSLAIHFSEPIRGGDTASNFELRNRGRDGILGTSDDGFVSFTATHTANTTALKFAGLIEGVYRLTIKDLVKDLAGNAIDGDDDGRFGGNGRYDFVVAAITSEVATTLLPTLHSGQQGSRFGHAVASDGNFRVVGAPYADLGGIQDNGVVYVYSTRTGALLTTLANPTPGSEDLFGSSVAVSGNRVVVGAHGDDAGANNSGSAYVFSATTGALLTTLINPTPAANDLFGSSVGISGNKVIVGARNDNTRAPNSGIAYVFNVHSGSLVSTLQNPTPFESDNFGISVAISDNTAIVGANSDDFRFRDSGSAYAFNATTGVLIANLANPTPAIGDLFGSSVAISGNKVVVGAYADDTGARDSGSAYIFTDTGAFVGSLINPTPAIDDHFGSSVAVSGDKVVVGARYDDSGASNSGSAHVFSSNDGSLLGTLVNPSPTSGANFGFSVAVSGDAITVGAHRDNAQNIDQGAAHTYSLNAHYALQSPSGRSFDVDRSSLGAGQLVHGSNNAFDGYLRMQVDDSNFVPNASLPSRLEDGGRTVVIPQARLSGLNVSREIFVPKTGTADFSRIVDVFHNDSPRSTVSVKVRYVGNLGSNDATTVFATSDGDSIVEPTDTWFATDDADGSGSPAVIHAFRSNDGKKPSRVEVIDDNVVLEYWISVPAGETLRLAHFTTLADTRAEALADAASLMTSVSLHSSASAFLNDSEEVSLINFGFDLDYGNTSTAYPKSARHVPIGPRLGESVNADSSEIFLQNQYNDDPLEDGVSFGFVDASQRTAALNLNLQISAALADGWIDFNGDGDWDDAGEQILKSRPVVPGINRLEYAVPRGATPGLTQARIRVSTSGGLSTGGFAADGEVEDYQIRILSGPAKILSHTVNSGQPSRSQLTSIDFVFDSIVTVNPNDFVLRNTTTNFNVGQLRIEDRVIDGKTHVKVTPAYGVSIVNSQRDSMPPSLADGHYTLRFLPSETLGNANPIDNFFRKFGDTNGNGVVDLIDFAAVRSTFGKSIGETNFNGDLDHDRDGVISLSDFAAFRSAFGQ